MTGVVHERTTGEVGGAVARPGGRAAVRWLATGLLGGLAWGVAARAWMRYVSDDPEFTWAGTLIILGVSVLAGLSLATVELLRRRGARLWRLVVGVPALVMFASAGAVMTPTAVLWGLAVSGRGGWWVRGPALLLGVAPLVAITVAEGGVAAFPHSAVVSLGWYLLLCAGLAVGWSTVWRRRVRSPRPAARGPLG